MNIALLLARLILAAVFGLSGIGKLLDLKASRIAVAGFGFPEWLANPIGLSLPFLELMAAVMLLPLATLWWGACSAFALLIAFALVIAVNMARGKRPECHCFGQLHSEPIGVSTLARNLSLALLAGLVLSQAHHNPGLSLTAALRTLIERHPGLSSLVLIALLFLSLQAWLVLHLFRQNGRLLLRIETLEAKSGISSGSPVQSPNGLKVGATAPEFELRVAGGEKQSLSALRAQGKPVFLLFTDPKCGPCTALLPDAAKWAREHIEKLTIALISRGEGAVNEQYVKEYGLKYVLVQNDREVAEQYKAFGTPSAVLVHPNGTVGSGVASGAPQIAELVARATGTQRPLALSGAQPLQRPETPAIGTPAPSFVLPDVSGNQVRLEDFKGRDTLLLFWNPGCGFCNRMLPRLKEWEHTRNNSAPQLLVLSTGTREQNREMGIHSPVVLDEDQSSLRLFGAAGTPSGLLLDANGKINSRLAMGAEAIFKLAACEKAENVSGMIGKSVEVREAAGD